MTDNFVMTVFSDEDENVLSDEEDATFDPAFDLELAVDSQYSPFEPPGNKAITNFISIDDLISRHVASSNSLKKRKREHADFSLTSAQEEADSEVAETSGSEEEKSESGSLSSDETEEENTLDVQRKTKFFATTPSEKAHASFLSMNLSRPLLKSLSSMSFQTPTPIQSAAIPVALLGKDIVASAVTGSGKTAAFLIPILERLVHRDKSKQAAATRCLVLVPTRELAVQCFEVGKKLASSMDVDFCLLVGGLSLKMQEVALRKRPDIVIATPGRLIDHLHNSPNFTLDALDVLIIDEADRMLDDGFHDELTEIVKSCPPSRQTMLFSATMTDSVDDLIKLSLVNPVRLFVDPMHTTAKGLVQEFIRIKAGKEEEKSATLLALCQELFKTKVIVFLRSKKLAHQLRITFGVLGLKCGELHGDLTQEQRLNALQSFRDGTVDYMMATDLASRGLDIKGIQTVINYDMPGQLAQYLHRVGRTARAGKSGRSITLVGEADRKLLKAILKHSWENDKIRHRTLSPHIVTEYAQMLSDVKEKVIAVLEEEKEHKAIIRAEMEIKKGQNIIEHEREILSRPARVWFQSTKEKALAGQSSKEQYMANMQSSVKQNTDKSPTEKPKRDKLSGLSRKVKRRKIAQEDEEVDKNATRAIHASIRSAKRANKPVKIGAPEIAKSKKALHNRRKIRRGASEISKGGFELDLNNRAQREGARAEPGDKVKGLSSKAKRRPSGR